MVLESGYNDSSVKAKRHRTYTVASTPENMTTFSDFGAIFDGFWEKGVGFFSWRCVININGIRSQHGKAMAQEV